jgi:hypothetical protein
MPKRLKENPLLSTRSVRIHSLFKAKDEETTTEIDPIFQLWIEVKEHLNRASDREIAREEKEWSELKKAIDKLSPIISSVLNGEQNSIAALDDDTELVPDTNMRRKVVDWYADVLNRKPEDAEQARAELEDAKKEHAVRKRIFKCSRSNRESVSSLYQEIENGSPGAAEALLEAATNAVFHLMLASQTHPEVMKEVAAMNSLWPVIAKDEPGWEKTAANHIAKLELGKGATRFKTSLRKLRGSDIQLPARRWARAAVLAIDETRWKAQFLLHMIDKLGGSDEWAFFAVKQGWNIADYPSWVASATKLKPFTVKTFDSWKALVREIIREQMPDFHLLPEWATQRMTAEANGRDTPGEIQNAILDDIISALKRLAPEAGC